MGFGFKAFSSQGAERGLVNYSLGQREGRLKQD
jgi:hypothetical protein